MVKRHLVSDDDLEELIHQYCRDITRLAEEDRFDIISGRDKEIRESCIILLQKGRKNVALIAPAGVGKTAMIVGLAQKIIADDVPNYLKGARVIELDLSSMAAGTNGPADFQERFIPLCRGFAERYHDPKYPKFILFIDEMHTIMPTCEGSAYRGLSEVMKPYLTVGDLHVMGATTEDEYRIYVQEDPAMDRRFQKVPLKVPTNPETLDILKILRPGLEKHHQITIPDNCLDRAVELTGKYMPRRNNPDKSIIVVDGACALQVMELGNDADLEERFVNEVVSIECKIHKDAL